MEKLSIIEEFIDSLGLPIFMIIAFLFLFYKLFGYAFNWIMKSKEEAITRENKLREEAIERENKLREEAITRENKLREEAAIREEKLMEYMGNQTASLQSIAMTMESTNEINRGLASRVDLITEKLDNIDNNVKILMSKDK